MPVDPRLLEVQEQDSATDRINHKLATLAEKAALDEARSRQAELAERAAELNAVRERHDAERRRLDDEVSSLRAKLEREETKLGSARVSSARELAGLQAEVASLKRRIGDLEDAELEAMERLEELAPDLAKSDADAAAAEAEVSELADRLRAVAGDLEGELAGATEARAQAAALVDDDLLAKYERTRERSVVGIGAAALVDGACQGCHLKLPAGELGEVEDMTLPRCPSCGVLLVLEARA